MQLGLISSRFAHRLGLGGAWVAWLVAATLAQDPATPVPGTSPITPPSLPESLGPGIRPDIYLLKNDRGEDIVVPRATYEEFERTLRSEAAGGAETAPPPTLSSIELSIEPDEDFARVGLTATARFSAPTGSWNALPLGLGQLQWLPPEHSNEATEPVASPMARDSVSVISPSNGYLWRLPPTADRERVLRLRAVCKLIASNNGSSLRLDLPAAATVLRLKLPDGDWELAASGSGSEVVEPFRSIDGMAVAVVRTTANSVNLAWNRKAEREALVAIEGTSQTKFSASVDGSQVRAMTTLSLRGPIRLGGSRFQVVLPRNSQLRDAGTGSSAFTGFRVQPRDGMADSPPGDALSGDAPPDQSSPPTVLDVEIDESITRTEMEIPLEWQWSGPSLSERLPFLAPFLQGVERHSGSIECVVPRTMVFDWLPLGDTRLLRQGPASDASDSFVYTFQFDGQPAGVEARWQTLNAQPRLRAKHKIEIHSDRIWLWGDVEFLSDPLQLPLLQLELLGWKLEQVVLQPMQLEIDPKSAQEVSATGGISLPIHASYWLSEAGRGAAPVGNASPTGSTSSSLPAVGTSTPRDFATNTTGSLSSSSGEGIPRRPAGSTRIEYVLSQTVDPSASSLGWTLPQWSWLSSDSQTRITRSLSGSMEIRSWLYALRSAEGNHPGMTPAAQTSDPQVASARSVLGGFGPDTLVYQTQESIDGATWKGERERRPSATSIRYEAFPTIDRDAIRIRHRWYCTSFGTRPDKLWLGFPRASGSAPADIDSQAFPSSPRPPELTLDGVELAAAVEIEPLPGLDPSKDWIRLELPKPTAPETLRTEFLLESYTDAVIEWTDQGECDVEVVLPVLRNPEASSGLTTESADLRRPQTSGAIFQSAGVEIEGTPGGMEPGSSGSLVPLTMLDPDAPRWSGRLTRLEESPPPQIHFELEWVQTILSAIYQRDRYVARFTTDRDSIDLHLPLELQKDAEVLLNGKRTALHEVATAPDRVRVVLNENADRLSSASEREFAADPTHVLEVFTLRPATNGWIQRLRLHLPRLESDPSQAPLLWQLVVPRTEHLLGSSQSLTPRYRWEWKDLFLTRVSELEQADLEQTLGASRQPVVAPQQTNQYLLTSVASTGSLQVVFLPRMLIWLPIASLVLALSIVARDSRWLTRPWVWIFLLVAFGIFSQWAWDVSILVVQTTLAALSLSVAYGVMRWLLDRRARRRSIFVSRSTSAISPSPPRSHASSLSEAATSALPASPPVETSNIHASNIHAGEDAL